MNPVLRRSLRSLAAAGVRRLPRALLDAQAVNARIAQRAAPTTDPTANPAADPAAELAAIAAEVSECSACSLCETRQNTVPGEGSTNARVMFIGEGPGADEDRSGRPFVGRAGKLLDDIITKGMKRRREDVFICNVVKCRPPGNRTPTSREASACGAFLERQLRAIAPKVICSLGAAATHLLLDTDRPIGKLRGRAASWHGIPVIPTYHPAYLLRSPEAKKPCWEDIQMVMGIADRT